MYVVHTCTYMLCMYYEYRYLADLPKPVFIDRFIGQNTLQMTGQERYLNVKKRVRLPTKQYFCFLPKISRIEHYRGVYPLFSGSGPGSGKNVFFFEKKAKISPRFAMKFKKRRFFGVSKKCHFWHFLCLVPIFGQKTGFLARSWDLAKSRSADIVAGSDFGSAWPFTYLVSAG